MTGLILQAALVGVLSGGDARNAVRYDPQLMELMATRRGSAVSSCLFAHPVLPIGGWAWIRGMRTGHMERCRQVDTSQDIDTTGHNSGESDRQRHIRTKRVELGHDEALRICGGGWEGAAMECPVVLWVVPDRADAKE